MANLIETTKVKALSSVSIQNIPKVKEAIKATLPVLKSEDIRRHRIPYHESTILELHEAGYYEAAEYFKFLYEIDDEARRKAGPNTLVWNKPKLQDNKELIDHLREILTIFCQREIPADKRTLALMKSAIYIGNLNWEWWWIAESLYRTSFWVAKEIKNDKQIISILRYIYARFLFFQMDNPRDALEYIREAQKDSRDKAWNVTKLLGIKQGYLFRECCVLSYKVLVQIARDTRNSDTDVAVNSCKVALNSAIESGYEEHVSEAYYELGKSEIVAGNVKEALKQFSKCLAVMEKIPNPLGICRAHNQLALAYKVIGDDKNVLDHLQKSKDNAAEFGLPLQEAKAYFLTGEYYLDRENPKEATPNLEQAFSLYNSHGAKEEANRARCLTGVARGQEMMGAYLALIMKSVQGDVEATMKICRWKDRGEPFQGITINEGISEEEAE